MSKHTTHKASRGGYSLQFSAAEFSTAAAHSWPRSRQQQQHKLTYVCSCVLLTAAAALFVLCCTVCATLVRHGLRNNCNAAAAVTCVACLCRPRHDSPVTLGGVRLLLPQPEFDYLEAAAKAASSFVVDLQGELAAPLHMHLCSVLSGLAFVCIGRLACNA